MKRFRVWLTVLGALAAASIPANSATVFLTLDPPEGALAAQAGTSIGWGYTITTDSGFVTIETITFAELTPIGTFSTPGIPSTAASFGSPIISPWIVDISGLQYDISAGAVLGAATQGPITLTYDTFSDAGMTNQIGFGDTVNATLNGLDVAAQVTVNAEAGAATTTPEPGAMTLIGLGLAALTGLRRRRITQ